jgi:putative restriction endonuclease
MRYWWVNQNQTFRQEIAGGYLWSPKRKADGARNPFYDRCAKSPLETWYFPL